jgi:acyl-coenzyme A synthetase/AMP-(fatty) acid ligase
VIDLAPISPASSQGDWQNRTIYEAFCDVVAASPGKEAVVAGDQRVTYGELAQQVSKLAASLHRLGIGKGDVISVQLPNWVEFAVIHLAATQLGAVTNPLLPIYREKELSYILGFAKTKLAFIPASFRKHNYIEMFRGLRSNLPDLDQIVVVGGDVPDGMIEYQALIQATDDAKAPVAPSAGDDLSVLIFTSGTEASPKGVLHTHDTLMFGNVVGGSLLGLGSDDIIWAVSPIGHATGLEWTLRQAIVVGGTVVLQEVWDVERALDLIEKERCTFTTAAASFAMMLLEAESLDKRDLTSFKTFLCGGAAIPPTLGKAVKERIGCDLVPCWGMSECFAATMCAAGDSDDRRFGTDGRALPGSETAIFDDTRTNILAPGEVGEIATRGPHVSKGYFNAPERTKDTFINGWLFSNDLGVMDEAGYLRVVGRMKDIINRGGLKISAAEVENALRNHPAVAEVALVAIADRKLGERAVACVVTKENQELSLDELIELVKQAGVSAYKWPEFIARLPQLPMTPTGKVQKFVLREELESGRLPMNGAS